MSRKQSRGERKGKPGATRGRKAPGLSEAAELPNHLLEGNESNPFLEVL